MVFAGCSFTHSGDSWAYQPQPKNKPHVEEIVDPCEPWGDYLLREQSKLIEKVYGIKNAFDPETFWANSHRLPEEQYEINIFGRGSNSNTDTARCIMHFIENYEHDIDTVVMQISGFARRELYTASADAIEHANTFSGYIFNTTNYDDATFIKHHGCIDLNEIKNEETKDALRTASARFYAVAEQEEYHIRAIEQLQSLTNFCKVHNIKLAYFHGWDNIPENTTEYFNKKYNKYVKPYLLSQDSIISYAQKHLEEKFVYDIMTHNYKHGGHPCPLAHQLFWNNIVYPFVKL
jgi:hypothetical protein